MSTDMMPEEHRRGRGLGLRGRLILFFVAITVVPLLVAVLALQLQIDRQLQLRSEQELRSVRRAAVSLIDARRARAADTVRDVTSALGSEPLATALSFDTRVQSWLEEQVGDEVPGRADVVAIVAPDGEVVAATGREPRYTEPEAGSTIEDLGRVARDGVLPTGALVETVQLVATGDGQADDEVYGWVVSALWTDEELLESLGISGGAAVTVGPDVLAVTGGSAEEVPARGPTARGEAAVREQDEVLLVSAPLGEGTAVAPDLELVVWTPRPERPSSLALALVLVLPGVLIAGALGWVIAGTVVGPVRRAADVARGVAAGDLSRQLEPGGGPELTDLAVALNSMSAELAARLDELEQSQERLRGSLKRLGRTLSSSLDLNRTLSVIVETAKDTLGADRALLLLFTPERDALYMKVGRGMEGDVPRLRVDGSRLGHVASTAQPIRLPGDERPAPPAAPGEPVGASQLAVPMLGRGRVLGVLSLFIDDESRRFSQTDLDTIRSFGAQASVAIENVMLHQEAQRLSVTDPLTGLWNFRYFQLQADREVESAARFERPLSLIVVDIDHFKPVNDTYGHQVGDEVLIEMARRLRDSTRVPDVVARYGGEEFVVLLPATDLEGGLVTAERIRASFAGTPVSPMVPGVTATSDAGGVDPIHITCSVGVATLPDHGRTVAGLLRSADSAMYVAKQQGRNRVVAAGGADGIGEGLGGDDDAAREADTADRRRMADGDGALRG